MSQGLKSNGNINIEKILRELVIRLQLHIVIVSFDEWTDKEMVGKEIKGSQESVRIYLEFYFWGGCDWENS